MAAGRTALDRAVVAAAALDLLDEVGLDGLSVRRLAGVLGVKSPALYWHFRDKAELLDLMAQEILRPDVHGPARSGQGWQEWVGEGARRRRRALLSRRDGARLIAGTRPGPEIARHAEADLRVLCEAGFTAVGGFRLLVAVGHYVTGFVIEEQGATRRHAALTGPVPDVAEIRASTPTLFSALNDGGAPESDDAFEHGLAALLLGLEAMRTTGSRR
ncbi:MAG: TetR/AcrR family transcriptional regulator C-terminal domain-containing protein [Pseudonocardia sp.]|nr:TetR/AcrR family transcriptional regulator C-terminal domain-containing protein [Pseudonocardia sp.]